MNQPTMNRKDRLGIVVLVLILLGGAWMMAAPFVVGYQARGGSWPIGTKNDFFVGLGIVALTAAALVVFAGNALAEISHRRPDGESDDELGTDGA